MNINFIFVLILTIRGSLGDNIFVDLKSNYISDGITVHHGRYSVNGRYMMCVGKDETIDSIVYGTGMVYERVKYPSGETLMIELFEDILAKYFVIHAFTGKVLNHTKVKRKYYKYSDAGYSKIDHNTFMNEMTSEVELMFDISKKVMHPYMSQTVEYTNYYTETYSMIKQVGGIRLDGFEAPKYTYGIVYDSSMMIKMGYSTLDSFVTKCEKFSIEYNLYGNKIKFKMALGTLEYRVIVLMNKLIWDAQIKEYKDAVQRDHVDAINTYAKFSDNPEQHYPIILDVAESVSPELFGIDKVTGSLGNGYYVIYHMKKEYENHYIIGKIVDTECENIAIVNLEERYIISSVEVFTNKYRKVVVIHSLVMNQNLAPIRRDMFKRKLSIGQDFYLRVSGEAKKSTYSKLETNFPVRINLFLDQRETSVYESKETINETENFTIFNIKESDVRGIDDVFKFVFGDIMERRKYKMGNLPEEPCRKVYDVVKKNIFQTEVIVARSRSEQNPEMGDYNVFNIL